MPDRPNIDQALNATVESIVVVAERIARAPVSPQERSDLTGLLVLLSGVRLRPEAVISALRRNGMLDELLEESGMTALLAHEGMRRSVRLK